MRRREALSDAEVRRAAVQLEAGRPLRRVARAFCVGTATLERAVKARLGEDWWRVHVSPQRGRPHHDDASPGG